MGFTPSPMLLMSSLIGQYQERAGHVITEGAASFPLIAGDTVDKNPVLNLHVDMDFKTQAAVTLDLGPTNRTKDFSSFPSYLTGGIPLFIDPGWLGMLVGGDPQDQVAWGGKLLVKHMILRCELGAMSIHVGGLDPFGDYPGNPAAKTRPFILQAGGVFAQSLNGVRPFTVIVDPGLPDTPKPFVQGLPSILIQTFEDLNRIRIVVFIDRYN